MSQQPSESQPQPVLKLIAWTLGPTAFFLLVMKAANFLPGTSRAAVWIILLVPAACGVAQCVAYQKSRGMIRTRPLLTRALGYLCAAFSALQVCVWFGILMFLGYYATHPGAPMVFGGK